MHLRDLELKIPEKLIATKQAKPRDASKLVIVDDTFKVITFNEIVNLLNPHDALIFNNTKVINAHIDGKINNRKVSVNLNKIIDRKKVIWSVFLKSNKSPKINDKIIFNRNFSALVIHEELNKNLKVFYIKFNCKLEKFKKKLVNLGKIPLPPYITKKRNRTLQDQKNYQTVFAKKEGAVAAPTASLHFTKKLINKLKKKNIKLINITLHVNGGTFIPIKTNNILDHKIHSEFGEISKKSAEKINEVKKNGGKIIAIGTTVLRLLESSKNSQGMILPFKGETDIFIKPGSSINTVDGIITNFHTPKSTLLLLVFALLGKNKTLKLYKFAINKKLRFFSYGDACLIWNKNDKF